MIRLLRPWAVVLLLACRAFAEPQQGLTLSFASAGKVDAREARLVGLHVPAGQAPTPFLPAGQFTAIWSGTIASPLRAQCAFSAQLTGEVKVTINGQAVLSSNAGAAEAKGETVQLKKGANELRVEYHSPATGDAMLRLYWSGKDFLPEPVPPTVFMHDASDELTAATTLREGRLLFAQRRCIACHDGGDLLPARGEGMPELAQDAPVFADFGARFNEAWLAHWINDPHSIRPHSLMPRIFPGEEGTVDQRAADLAAYLISLGQRNDAAPAEDQALAGGALFANLGCIACHTTPEFQGDDDFRRVPLGHLKAKWQAPALKDYLLDPQKLYPGTRMPNFRLSAEESARLTAFLLSGNQREFPAPPKGDASKGAALALSAGCLNCHANVPPTATPKLAETLKSGWKKGCIADAPEERGAAPDFAFTVEEREALRALAAAGFDSFKHDTAAEFAQRQVKNLRCNACHPMDGQQSIWSQLDNDIAPLTAGAPPAEGEGQPQPGTAAPLFTWLGEKLQSKWAAPFIAGTVRVKPRTWLIARMPGFGVRGELIAPGLAQQHGFPAEEPLEAAPPEELVKAGEKLLGESGGFNCVMCHALGERPPTAPFEAPGIDLALSTTRLRKHYYHRWVYNPQRIDPETKMPKFADEQGKTPLTETLQGDADRQYEAIWQYLRTVEKK